MGRRALTGYSAGSWGQSYPCWRRVADLVDRERLGDFVGAALLPKNGRL